MSKTAITSPELAPPVGPFSQAVKIDGFLYFSGQVAQDPATGKVVEGGIVPETERVFQNLSAVLKTAGKSFDDVVQARVFLTRMSDFVAMNGIYAKHFSQPFPARTTIAAAELPLGACVEIDLVVKDLAQAQSGGIQAAFARDAGTLCDKFTGLARVMSGKHDWKPGQGVRSVAEVFNLIVKENDLLAGALSGTPNTGTPPAPITDPEKLEEALNVSYVDVQKAITGVSDNDLHTSVKMFGRDMTKLGALMLIIQDQHEHLGQSIAYARSNGLVPPWSK